MRWSQTAKDKMVRNACLHFHTNIFLNSSLHISTWLIIIRIIVILLTILEATKQDSSDPHHWIKPAYTDPCTSRSSSIQKINAYTTILYVCSLIMINRQVCISLVVLRDNVTLHAILLQGTYRVISHVSGNINCVLLTLSCQIVKNQAPNTLKEAVGCWIEAIGCSRDVYILYNRFKVSTIKIKIKNDPNTVPC